jgi:hypothetical protein
MDSYQPLPAYGEVRTQPSQLEDDLKRYQVNRKPIPSQSGNSKPQYDKPLDNGLKREEVDYEEVTPRLPPRPDLSLQTHTTTSDNSRQHFSPNRSNTSSSTPSVSTEYGYGSPRTDSFPLTLSATSTGSIESSLSQSSASSQMKKAYQEARHFAGGLIQRPCESTKHFTILRHSHGLVFYQGSSTSLAISIFSDEPLPPDRTLWLQSKGWTGKTGMRARAFMGRNGNWLDVTPTLTVGTEQLNPTDERAWQRDFQRFQKKAPAKIRDRHHIRETAVVRIPAEAGDGYFQLVLCTTDKKKVLCTSPAFRVLSTSMSPSSIRGASLSTLPLELGAMVLTTYGKGTVGNTVSAVTSPFQSQIQQYMPSFWTRKAASAAYDVSGAHKKIESEAGDAESRYEMACEDALAIAEREELELEEGPQSPYPINFIAAYQTTAIHSDQFNLPIITLSVPEQISRKLHGYYFGWARSIKKQQKGKSQSAKTSWVQAMLAATLTDISQLARVSIEQANQKNFTLHIIQESEDDVLSNFERFEVRVMGFIRPDEPAQRLHLEEGLQEGDEAAAEASMLAEINDVSMVQGILDHPSWSSDATERESAENGKIKRIDKLKRGYADTRMAAQIQVDRIPFHKVGMRAPGDVMRDRAVLMNGFYVIR